MALDVLSLPFSPEAGPPPSKRRRLGWDVPDPALLAEAARLQFHLASQLFQVFPPLIPSEKKQSTSFSKLHDDGFSTRTENASNLEYEDLVKQDGKRSRQASSKFPPLREDDEDGHLNFKIGDILTSRYKVLQKMGEGTFGRVLECWDEDTKEVVAIKVVRSAEKYREAAMIEIDHLHTLSQNDKSGTRGKAYKYFRHEKKLNWPDRYTSRESVRAVVRIPKLSDLLKKHADKSSSSLTDLLERMFCYDPSNRLTTREALQHPFFQVPSVQ